MRRYVVMAGVLAYACFVAYAVTAMKKTVDEMSAEADHVVTARVTEVEMIGRGGKPSSATETSLTEPDVIRLHVTVDPVRTIKGGTDIPSTLVFPLWRGWGHSLSDVKGDMLDKEFVFFLKGPEYAPLFRGEFYLPVKDMKQRH